MAIWPRVWGGASEGIWGEFEIFSDTQNPAAASPRLQFILVALAACLLAIWPLPNTIALRQILLVTGAVLAVRQMNWNLLTDKSNWHIWLLPVFFAWLVFHYFVLPTNSEEQLYELRGDWLRALLAAIVGLGMGLLLGPGQRAENAPVHRYQALFIAGLAGTIFIYVLRYAYEVMKTGQAIHTDFYMEPYLGKTPLVVFGSIFITALFAKLCTSMAPRERTRWIFIAAIALVCVSLSYYFANTKNGFIVLLLAFAAYTFRLIKSSSHGTRVDKVVFVIVFVALIGFLKSHIEANPSWLNFYSDVKAGHDIEHNFNWKNSAEHPLPINDRGETANGSTYERSAWATAGIQLVTEHPLGYGLINHSFGALALDKWPDFYKPVGKYRHASHSGWLDFTLGFGVPGLLLVLLPMWVSYRRAARHAEFWFVFVRWSFPVMVMVYTVTEVCTGHFIEFLFFYVALISGITAKKKGTSDSA